MPFTTADVEGHSLTFSVDLGDVGFLGDVQFKSITAYRKVKSLSFGDIEDFDSRLDAAGAGLMNDTLLTVFGQLYGPSSGFAYPFLDNVWNAVDAIGAFHTQLDDKDRYEQFSQEVHLTGTTDRMEYVVGLYYFDEEDDLSSEPDRGNIYLAPLSGGGRATSNKANSNRRRSLGRSSGHQAG